MYDNVLSLSLSLSLSFFLSAPEAPPDRRISVRNFFSPRAFPIAYPYPRWISPQPSPQPRGRKDGPFPPGEAASTSEYRSESWHVKRVRVSPTLISYTASGLAANILEMREIKSRFLFSAKFVAIDSCLYGEASL